MTRASKSKAGQVAGAKNLRTAKPAGNPANRSQVYTIAADILRDAAELCRRGDPFPRLEAVRRIKREIGDTASLREADNLSAAAARHVTCNVAGRDRTDRHLDEAAALVRTGWEPS